MPKKHGMTCINFYHLLLDELPLSPEFKEVNPMKQVPAIMNERFKLSESHAILKYLACAFPGVADHWRTRKKHVGGSTEDAREGEDARVIEERRPSSKVQSSRGHVSDQVE
ncbi:hypothetical protein T459_08967 [Capsicum annuum]|uniref:GST N-terminal domain-containing protein n=1 Tax=Capsicum annuum TaxID=4072 RepID=A0A2G2ZY34_CAPAN|nr:hypothetical protein T459_08967 [Capsicum annuum]